MRLSWVVVVLLAAFSSLPFLPPVSVHAIAKSSSVTTGRVTVGFRNNTRANTLYMSSKYNLPIVMENDVLQFALFRPPSPSTFITYAKQEAVVKYAEQEY